MNERAKALIDWAMRRGAAGPPGERRRIESHYRQVLDAIDEGFCIIEMVFDAQRRPVDYLFIDVNAIFEQQTGLADVRGKRASEVAPMLEQFWFEQYGSVAETGQPLRFEHQASPLGRVFDVFAFPFAGPGAAQVGVLFRDITERMQRDAELKQAQERLALAQQVSHAGVWELNVETGETVWSREHYLIFGLEPEPGPLSSARWRPLVHRDDLPGLEAQLADCWKAGKPLFSRFRIVRPSGEVRWLNVYGNTIVDERRQPLRMLGLSLDVTETHELEAAVAAADASSRAKSSFMAMMSHELRTPLNAIIGFTSILLDGLSGELNEEQQGQLGIVKRSSLQLLELVSDVLDVAHIEGGSLVVDLQLVRLDELLQEQVEQLAPQAAERGLQLNHASRDGAPCVLADRRRLGQVIRNLLTNALKFTDAGAVTISVATVGGMARIAIDDTGIGIPMDQQHRLFHPFQRILSVAASPRPGAGLGLSISKRLIEAMGGEIGVESQPGRGTHVWCTVPLAPQDE